MTREAPPAATPGKFVRDIGRVRSLGSGAMSSIVEPLPKQTRKSGASSEAWTRSRDVGPPPASEPEAS